MLSGCLASFSDNARRQGRLRAALSALLHHRLRAAWAGWRQLVEEAQEAQQHVSGLQLRVLHRLQHQVLLFSCWIQKRRPCSCTCRCPCHIPCGAACVTPTSANNFPFLAQISGHQAT